MDKAYKIKEIFERKIEHHLESIQKITDRFYSLEKENRNKSITVAKYEWNKSVMATCEKDIDRLQEELRAFHLALMIINNVLEEN